MTTDRHEIQRSVDGNLWQTVGIQRAQSYLAKHGDIGKYGWKGYDIEPHKQYIYRIITRERSGSYHIFIPKS
ncbi:MAG: hypothetical protein ABDH66_01180 [Bacteroidia bacterium]